MEYNNARGEKEQLIINYKLDKFKRWINAELLWPIDQYDMFLERQIRYNGDVRPLTVFLEHSAINNTGNTEHSPKEAVQWVENLDGLKSSFGSRVILFEGDGISCIGADGEKEEYSKIFEVSTGTKFTYLDRTAIDDVLNEQKLSLTGLVDNQYAVEVGQIMGAEMAVVIDVGCLEMRNLIEVKAIDIETSEVEWAIMGIGADFKEFLGKFMEKMYEAQ